MRYIRRTHLSHIKEHLIDGTYNEEIDVDLNIMLKDKIKINRIIYSEFYLRLLKLLLMILSTSYCFAMIFKICINLAHHNDEAHEEPETDEERGEWFYYAYLDGQTKSFQFT